MEWESCQVMPSDQLRWQICWGKICIYIYVYISIPQSGNSYFSHCRYCKITRQDTHFTKILVLYISPPMVHSTSTGLVCRWQRESKKQNVIAHLRFCILLLQLAVTVLSWHSKPTKRTMKNRTHVRRTRSSHESHNNNAINIWLSIHSKWTTQQS